MRVLMIAPEPFFRPSGTPFSVFHRIRALLRLGHTVDLVTYPLGESPELPGLEIHRVRKPPGVRNIPIGPSVVKLILDGPLFLKAYRMARAGRYDLLHTHEEAGAMGAWIGRACGLPHLYDMHSSLPQQFANFGRFNWRPVIKAFERLERYILGGADGVIAICAELHDHVVASDFPRPLAMIENTLDFEMPAISEEDVVRLRERLGLTANRVILYTGSLEQYQGLDLLLEAMAEVAANEPSARLLIVGGTREQIAELEGGARALGVDRSLVFVPAVPPREVFVYHRLADVLVTTRSSGTNTPLKIYQYLRADRPIVATAIRSHTQVLDESCAELVAPEPGAIARGLERVLSDPHRARDLAAAAGELARERYSEQVYLERLSGLLAKIINGAAQRRAVA